MTRGHVALDRDVIEGSTDNPVVDPGKLEALGTPIDLSQITVDTYLVAGISDHITPWQNCYRSTQLLGSEPRFVRSTSGHIAAMVNPPGNDRASYQTHDGNPPSPEEWLEKAAPRRGTWWADWLAWLGERSGEETTAPPPGRCGRGWRAAGRLRTAPGAPSRRAGSLSSAACRWMGGSVTATFTPAM